MWEDYVAEHRDVVERLRRMQPDHPAYLQALASEAEHLVEREIPIPEGHQEMVALFRPTEECPEWARPKLEAAVRYIEEQR